MTLSSRRLAPLALALLLAGCATAVPLEPAPTARAPVESAQPRPAEPAASAVAAAPAASAPQGMVEGDNEGEMAAEAPVDPLRPEARIDLDDRAARVDLWQRIRDGFAIRDIDDRYVRARERYYSGQPDYVQRMTDRGSRYLFHIVEEVQRRGLPTELALLPFIESAFNPEALSSARASGMWQFMPATGRHFDLKQNVFRDDRRDVLASTRAALDYLTRLHEMFGDWHLALAAYNWGEGNVQRAVRANRAAGRGTDYASLKMPFETRDYVPKLQAMKNIVLRPADYGLSLPALENHPYFLAVPIARDIDVALAARLAELPLDEFRALNPQMNKPLILAAGTPQVLLPYDNANAFVKALPQHKGPLASWTAWTAPKTMRPAEVAKTVGMDEDELREVNNIPPRVLVTAGSTLLVPRARHRDADVSERLADAAMVSFAPDGPKLVRVSLRAGKRGDSVAAVAKRYGVSAAQVAQWNRVSTSAHFAPGSTIIVHVPQRKATTRTAGGASPAKASSKASAPKRNGKPVRVAQAGNGTRRR